MEKLENHMEAQKVANNKDINDLTKELIVLSDEYQATRKYITDEEGEKIINPDFVKTKASYDEKENLLEERRNSNAFINAKLEELAVIEENSGGKIDKSKEKITLTLNDCLLLGVKEK
ncbi:hypothetical protein [Virgibacillus salexigens]|uniref:hypothetical protein n=1 Tax=Virgibacillus massiliensis TaxID=1462526 RepID=UPI001CA31C81|nr:hypothetical protein [Virgibacillus massiliensis]